MYSYEQIATSTKLPDYLYHYTSLDALIGGIITIDNIKLRCSHYDYLNDPNEMHIGELFTHKILQEADIHNFSTIKKDVFILSLSKEKDSLPMWNMYGKGGKGVMLEFRTSVMSEHFLNLESCLYCNKRGELVGNDIAARFNRIVNFLIEAHKPSFPPKIMSQMVGEMQLDAINCIVKSADFKHEREVRAVFDLKNKSSIEFYLKNNIVVPYITIELPKNSIRRIWIGPTQDKNRTRKSLDMFLKSLGYDIDVVESEIEYRD